MMTNIFAFLLKSFELAFHLLTCFKVDDWSFEFGGDFLDLTEFIQVVKSANEQSQPELEQVNLSIKFYF